MEVLRGAQALRAARQAFEQFELLEDQAVATAFRLPDVIQLDTDDLSTANALNAAKDALRTAVRTAATAPATRRRLCRRLFPRCYMNQVYRHVPVVEPPIVRLAFTWSPVTVSTKTLTGEEAIALVSERAAAEQTVEWRASEEVVRRVVGSQSSATRIIQRLPVAPHPRLALSRAAGRDGRVEMVHANLPALSSSKCKSTPTRPLCDFRTANSRMTRSDKVQLRSLQSALNLFIQVENR